MGKDFSQGWFQMVEESLQAGGASSCPSGLTGMERGVRAGTQQSTVDY